MDGKAAKRIFEVYRCYLVIFIFYRIPVASKALSRKLRHGQFHRIGVDGDVAKTLIVLFQHGRNLQKSKL